MKYLKQGGYRAKIDQKGPKLESVSVIGVEQWWVQVVKDGSALPPPKEEKKKKSHGGH